MTRSISFAPLKARFRRINPAMGVASLVAIMILVIGWQDRRDIPTLPRLDADSLGYLYPALSFKAGEGLQQTHGRSVFYPSMLIVFLGDNVSFESMIYWQQALGLLGAICVWGIWIVLWILLPPNRLRDLTMAIIGPLILAFIYLNPSTIFYELTLRPEAVLPFFGALQLLTTGLYLLARTRRLPAAWLIPTGALAIILAYCCCALKPSWLMASAATTLIILVGWIRAGSMTRPALIGLTAGLLGTGGLMVTYKAWMIPDEFESALHPDTFLAKTLMTTHADLILPTLSDNLRTSDDPLLDKRLLRAFTSNFRKEMAVAREDIANYPQWKVHGVYYPFNPDHLMFAVDIAESLKEAGFDREQIASFYKRAYLLAVQKRPLDFASKVWSHLGIFFSPDENTFYKHSLMRALTESQEQLTTISNIQSVPAADRVLIAEEASRIGNYLQTLPDPESPSRQLTFTRLPLEAIIRMIGIVTPILTVAFVIIALQILGIKPLRIRFGVPLLFIAVLYAAPVANALTVAIVQSLPTVGRYRQTYGMFYALALGAMAACIINLWGLFLRLARSIPDSAFEDAAARRSETSPASLPSGSP